MIAAAMAGMTGLLFEVEGGEGAMTTSFDAGLNARSYKSSTCGPVLALLCGLLASAPPARAEGVLAVGITADVARDGFVIGYSVNKATVEEARDRAMSSCRNARAPNTEAAKTACTVVAEFRDKCVAIADDPKNGTTGFGWAVAGSRAEAVGQAVEMCKSASSKARASYCRLAHASCDGIAQ